MSKCNGDIYKQPHKKKKKKKSCKSFNFSKWEDLISTIDWWDIVWNKFDKYIHIILTCSNTHASSIYAD